MCIRSLFWKSYQVILQSTVSRFAPVKVTRVYATPNYIHAKTSTFKTPKRSYLQIGKVQTSVLKSVHVNTKKYPKNGINTTSNPFQKMANCEYTLCSMHVHNYYIWFTCALERAWNSILMYFPWKVHKYVDKYILQNNQCSPV